MRKLLLLSTLSLVIYVPISASNAQTLLKKARDDYYKQQAAEAKIQKAKAEKEAKAQRINTEKTKVEKSKIEKITNNDSQDELNLTDQNENKTEKLKKEKEPKPKNQLERLQKTAAKASDRVEFYESVARSVAREEIELKEYNEILGKKKSKYNKVPNIDGLGN